MTVVSPTSRWEYLGNATTGPFPYTRRILAASDLQVYVDNLPKTLTTHYTVSNVGEPGGGNVTFVSAPGNNAQIVILAVVAITQETDYVEHDAFPAEGHEDALDKLTMIALQQADALARAFQLPPGEKLVSTAVPTVAARANKVLAFDGAGLLTVLSQLDQSATTVLAQGGTVARSLAAHMGRALTPMDFGAAGDEVADDTTAVTDCMQFCAANAVAMSLAGRRFKVTATIPFGSDRLALDGGGGALVAAFAAPGFVLQLNGATNCRFSDFSIGATTTVHTGGIRIRSGAHDNVFIGVRMTGGVTVADREIVDRSGVEIVDAASVNNIFVACQFRIWWRGMLVKSSAGRAIVVGGQFENYAIGFESNAVDFCQVEGDFNSAGSIAASHADLNSNDDPIAIVTNADFGRYEISGSGSNGRAFWLKSSADDNRLVTVGVFDQANFNDGGPYDNTLHVQTGNLTLKNIDGNRLQMADDLLHEIYEETATTNAVVAVLKVGTRSTGTPAVGLGAQIILAIENSVNADHSTVQIQAEFTDKTSGSEDSLFKIRTEAAGTIADRLRLDNVALMPGGDNTQDCGIVTFRWNDIFATNATIQTSDGNDKREIAALDLATCHAFLAELEPVGFKWRDEDRPAVTRTVRKARTESVLTTRLKIEDGVARYERVTLERPITEFLAIVDADGKPTGRTVEVAVTDAVEEIVTPAVALRHSRIHWGLVGQDVEVAMGKAGILSEDFAGFIKDEATGIYALRMGEFVPLLLAVAKDLAARVAILEAR